jgi:citrate synthase
MGMGHRIYRVRDPRAEVLERATRALPAGPHTARVKLALAVERTATELLAERQPQRKLCANVEFFTAVLLEAVGIPRALFTVAFAAARVAGYCAHINEQRQTGRIVRPASHYVGPSRSRSDTARARAVSS